LFFFGIFFPLLWIVGALMRPTTGDESSIAADGDDYSTPTAGRDEATRIRTGL
jgi:hypothetical protein